MRGRSQQGTQASPSLSHILGVEHCTIIIIPEVGGGVSDKQTENDAARERRLDLLDRVLKRLSDEEQRLPEDIPVSETYCKKVKIVCDQMRIERRQQPDADDVDQEGEPASDAPTSPFDGLTVFTGKTRGTQSA